MWYNSVEFYVISGAIAAAAVVAASLPAKRKAAVLHTVAGELSGENMPDESPSLEVSVDEDRNVIITRRGLTGVTDNGAASLAITVSGFDVSIEERLTKGNGIATPTVATFVLDFFAPERYHIKYNSEDAGVFTAFTLNAMPGIHLLRPLK